jgi:hypothetical protein
MQRTARRAVAAAAAVMTMGATATATAAQAAPAQSAAADATSGPFHVTFHATRAAGAPPTAARGTFDAFTTVGPLALVGIHGAVTCLDVRGTRVGLFYPIDRSSPSLLARLGAGVLLSMTVDGHGHATGLQFVPLPVRSVTSCAPMPTPLPATGSATLSS